MLFTSLSAYSDAGSIADAVWEQKAVVPLMTKDFRGCVGKAIRAVPSVQITDQDPAVPMLIVLATPLNNLIAHMGVYVRHTSDNEAEVSFVGKGTSESDEQRKLITPLLGQLKSALSKECGNG